MPRTLALERKLESHSAVSCAPKRGISAGGAAGSNLRVVTATGNLSIASGGIAEGDGDGLVEGTDFQARAPMTSRPTNTRGRIRLREDTATSGFYFRGCCGRSSELVPDR